MQSFRSGLFRIHSTCLKCIRINFNDNLFQSPEILFRETRRFAGHSKWANIKHVKAEKDSIKSANNAKFAHRIKVAIREGGGSADPKQNSKLASVLEDAKDQQVPVATIKTVLERAKSRPEGWNEQWALKGPGKAQMLLDIYTDNRVLVRSELNVFLKKAGAMWTTDTKAFNSEGKIVCTERNKQPIAEEMLDDALSDALEVGAGDVIVADDGVGGKVLEFDVEPSYLPKIQNQLKQLGYKIAFADVVHSPLVEISLTEEEMKAVDKFKAKLVAYESVVDVIDNVAR